jgi:hypothetical protein
MTFPGEDHRMPRSAEARWLSAALRGDDAECARVLRRELPEGPQVEVVVPACLLAARRLFDERWDLRVITVFAQRVVERGPADDAVIPRYIEGFLRGMLGEMDLLTDDSAFTLEIPRVALFAMVDELALDDGAIDELLVEAEVETAKAKGLGLLESELDGDATLPDAGPWRRTYRRYLTDDDFVPRRHPTPRRPLVFSPEKAKGRRQGIAAPVSKAGRYLRSQTRRKDTDEWDLDQIPNADLLRVARNAFAAAVVRYLPPDPDISEIAALAGEARKSFRSEPNLMKAEYLVRTAMLEKMPLDGITSADVYISCVCMVSIIFDWWDSDDAASVIMAKAEEMVERKGHVLAR